MIRIGFPREAQHLRAEVHTRHLVARFSERNQQPAGAAAHLERGAPGSADEFEVQRDVGHEVAVDQHLVVAGGAVRVGTRIRHPMPGNVPSWARRWRVCMWQAPTTL